jgi:hypothetical protein
LLYGRSVKDFGLGDFWDWFMYLDPNGLKISGIAGDFAAYPDVYARIGLSDPDSTV